MRYRQPERASEERGYREPVGEPADEGGLGGRPNEQDQKSRLRCQGRREEQRRHRSEQRCRDQAIATKVASLIILRAFRHADRMRRPQDFLNIGWARYHLCYPGLARLKQLTRLDAV